MNYPFDTMHETLARWGAASRQSPEHEDALKSKVLAQVSTPKTPAPTSRLFLRIPKLVLAFAVLAAIAFVLPSVPQKEKLITTPMKGGAFALESQSLGSSAQIFPSISRLFPRSQPEVPATDTRELLKTDYSATIRTRRVQELGTQIQTMVRGFEGRIDSTSLTQNTGYVSLVIPATRLDAFRNELTSWVGPRFIVETTSAQNLLPEKRSLESEETGIQKKISSLQAQRATLVASYQRTKTQLERELDETTEDVERVRIQNRLDQELNTFLSKRRSVDAQIKNEQAALEQVQNQSDDLLDMVATVRGTISLQRINLFQMAGSYLDGYWLAAALGALAIMSYAWSLFRHPILWP